VFSKILLSHVLIYTESSASLFKAGIAAANQLVIHLRVLFPSCVRTPFESARSPHGETEYIALICVKVCISQGQGLSSQEDYYLFVSYYLVHRSQPIAIGRQPLKLLVQLPLQKSLLYQSVL
jgi:hypothetical protein